MQAKSFSGSAHGAIDPHTHGLPQAFIEDVRQGRFGRTVAIEPDKGSESIVTRGMVLGKDFEVTVHVGYDGMELDTRDF